jgi:hypothetical protein
MSDVPGDMPSTIIAPDLSLSTVDTEMEIEKSLPWTPARNSRPVGLVSPGAATIASGQSAALSHMPRAPLFLGRPRNPSPPSLLGSPGGGDTSTLRLQHQKPEEKQYQSFLPELSEADGIIQVGEGIRVDEFGTFLSEQEHELADDSDSGGSPQLSLRDALELPIPLLVTPRASEPELRLRAVPGRGLMHPRIPARLLRWRSSTGDGVSRDGAADPQAEQEQGLPELSWHGLDADPFRCSPPPPVPIEARHVDVTGGGTESGSGGGCEDVAISPRVDATFRWSTASLEVGNLSHTPEHEHGHNYAHAQAHTMSFPALGALTRRIREQGRALLRKSRSGVLLVRPRIPGTSFLLSPSSPLHPPPGTTTMALEREGFGSVRRIGLGIGYSLPSPGSAPQPARATPTHGHAAPENGEEAAPAGCYAGLSGGLRRGKKSAAQRAQQTGQRAVPEEPARAPDGHARLGCDSACASASGASPCDSGSVLILGNPGFGGAVAQATATTTNM